MEAGWEEGGSTPGRGKNFDRGTQCGGGKQSIFERPFDMQSSLQ